MSELIKTYTWQESYDMCQHGVCKYHSYDMDGCYCKHTKSFKVAPGYGASTTRMSLEGHCTGCRTNPAENKRQLFEPVEQ